MPAAYHAGVARVNGGIRRGIRLFTWAAVAGGAMASPSRAQESDTLRLADAIAVARGANPMLRAARLRAAAARAHVPQVGVPPDPVLSFGLRNRPLDGLPFSLVGGIWFLWLLGYNTSVAVWVGFIALAGVAAETGVVMLIYLDEAFHRHRLAGRIRVGADVAAVVREGALERLRPVVMTVTAITAGLMPILWSSGTGADVMKRIASPMVGGMISATVLTLLVIPAIYLLWRQWQVRRGLVNPAP